MGTDERRRWSAGGGAAVALLLLLGVLTVLSLQGPEPEPSGALPVDREHEDEEVAPSRKPRRPEAPAEAPASLVDEAPAPTDRELQARGIVLMPDGTPVGAGIVVTLREADAPTPAITTATTTADGTFMLHTQATDGSRGRLDRARRRQGARERRDQGVLIEATSAREDLVAMPALRRSNELGTGCWAIVRLHPARQVIVVVRNGEAPVPHAIVLATVVRDPNTRGRLEGLHARAPRLLRTDARGVLVLDTYAPMVEVWARKPDGVFGPGVWIAADTPGSSIVPVAPDAMTATLRLVDVSGDPLAGAIVRLADEDRAQAWLSDAPRLRHSQYPVDADGVVRLRFPVSPEPVLVGVATEDHRAVSIRIQRDTTESREATVVLKPKPRALLRIVLPEDAAAVPPHLKVEFPRSSNGPNHHAGKYTFETFDLGNATGPHTVPEHDVQPAVMAGVRADRRVRATAEPHVHELVLPTAGDYRVQATLSGLPPIPRPFIVGDDGVRPELEIEIPRGRAIRLRSVIAEPTEEKRPPTEAESSGYVAWYLSGADIDAGAASGAKAPRDSERVELGEALRPGGETMLWVPWEITRLAVRRFVPAKWSDVPHPKEAASVVQLPSATGSVVPLAIPAVWEGAALRPLRIRTQVGGSPVGLPHGRVRILQRRCDDGALREIPIPPEVVLDDTGSATVLVPRGEYRVRTGPQSAAQSEAIVTLAADKGGAEVVLAFK